MCLSLLLTQAPVWPLFPIQWRATMEGMAGRIKFGITFLSAQKARLALNSHAIPVVCSDAHRLWCRRSILWQWKQVTLALPVLHGAVLCVT